jgi:hypothetical protein
MSIGPGSSSRRQVARHWYCGSRGDVTAPKHEGARQLSACAPRQQGPHDACSDARRDDPGSSWRARACRRHTYRESAVSRFKRRSSLRFRLGAPEEVPLAVGPALVEQELNLLGGLDSFGDADQLEPFDRPGHYDGRSLTKARWHLKLRACMRCSRRRMKIRPLRRWGSGRIHGRERPDDSPKSSCGAVRE